MFSKSPVTVGAALTVPMVTTSTMLFPDSGVPSLCHLKVCVDGLHLIQTEGLRLEGVVGYTLCKAIWFGLHKNY